MTQNYKLFLPLFYFFSLLSFSSNFSQQEKLEKIKNITKTEAIDAEIKNIKDEIYKECLTELSLITGTSYNVLKKRIDEERILIKNFLQQEYFDQKIEHDPNIPEHMYYDLCKSIEEEKINPKNITLEYITSSDLNTEILAAATGKHRNLKSSIFSPRIRIYSKLELLKKSQQFIYKHEIYHLLLRHSLIANIANSHDSEHKDLDSIIEREADIHATLSNIFHAHQGVQRRCMYGHPNILDKESHCETMEVIYALMKRKNQLLYKDIN